MSSYHNRSRDWHLGNKIIINSIEHFNALTREGFEVKVIKFYGHPENLNCAVLLVRGEEQIAANANAINDYIAHLRELYDFNTGMPRFVYIPDTKIYHQFEEQLFDLLPRGQPEILSRKGLSFSIFKELQNWIDSQEGERDGNKKLSDTFFSVLVVSEKDNNLTVQILNKRILTLDKIQGLRERSSNYDKSVTFSLFLISSKTDAIANISDTLIGIILYDLVNKETLAFNIESLTSYIEEHSISENKGLYDVIKYLFDKTVNEKLEINSYLPFPIDSPCYAALPWICYSVHLPIGIDNRMNHPPERIVSIPEFFVFGYATSPEEESSFVFNSFSVARQGRALCILNLNELGGEIKYTLRFDQSSGEPLIHLDYSYYDSNEIKLIAHKILNFEEIYRFDMRLFIAMMLACLFDAYFSTLVKGGIKGLTDLANQNPAFLYPYYWIWMIETLTNKLNTRQDAYQILKNLYEGISLKQDERDFIKDIQCGDFSVASRDEDGNINV